MSTRRHIEIIFDRSGSMSSIASDAEGGLRAFLETQAKVPGDTTVSLTTFNHEVTVEYEMQPLAQVPAFTLTPAGTTALLDAVGGRLEAIPMRLLQLPASDRPEEVIFVIATDGYENASRHYGLRHIRAQVATARMAGWQFVFLAADESAFTAGDAMGIHRDTVLPFDRNRIEDSMTSAGHVIAEGSRTGTFTFTDEQRTGALTKSPRSESSESEPPESGPSQT
ncbi:hypothetical protein [Spirillospora sp. CA-128828]|uniref:hypothetical protein n=1 Tax=Spirillospora sp. CA-128828 TaxID=3240033 RepID=UPI003D8C042D